MLLVGAIFLEFLFSYLVFHFEDLPLEVPKVLLSFVSHLLVGFLCFVFVFTGHF